MMNEIKQIQELIFDVIDKGNTEDKKELLKLLNYELTILRGVLK